MNQTAAWHLINLKYGNVRNHPRTGTESGTLTVRTVLTFGRVRHIGQSKRLSHPAGCLDYTRWAFLRP